MQDAKVLTHTSRGMENVYDEKNRTKKKKIESFDEQNFSTTHNKNIV